MAQFLLTNGELDLVAHCLTIAADTLSQDAIVADIADTREIANLFRETAKEARELRERIDNRE